MIHSFASKGTFRPRLVATAWMVTCCLCLIGIAAPGLALGATHPVPKEHPRLLGSKAELQKLAQERAQAYQRVVAVARQPGGDDYSKMISMALVCAIDDDKSLGQAAVERAMKYVNGPIRKGHTTFGTDLALCAIVYDLCYDCWTAEQRQQVHRVHEQDRRSQRAVGGLTSSTTAGTATRTGGSAWRATPPTTRTRGPRSSCTCCRRIGTSGRRRPWSWPARAAAGPRAITSITFSTSGSSSARWPGTARASIYYADAPQFFRQRAIASMFEIYPGIGEYNSRRSIPMGDGGGRTFGGDRDKVLSARRILVNHFRDDPAHQAVHAFNEMTPRSSVGDLRLQGFPVARHHGAQGRPEAASACLTSVPGRATCTPAARGTRTRRTSSSSAATASPPTSTWTSDTS